MYDSHLIVYLQMLYNHVISDIRKLNSKHRNNRVNTVSCSCDIRENETCAWSHSPDTRGRYESETTYVSPMTLGGRNGNETVA